MLIFEAIKFYKLKNETFVRVLFLICFGSSLLFLFFPIGTIYNVSGLLNALQENDITKIPVVRITDVIYFISAIVFQLLLSLAGLIYTAAFISEAGDFPVRKGIISVLRRLHLLALYILFLAIPIVFSSMLFFIPVIIGYFALILVPTYITMARYGVFYSIIRSIKDTNGKKLIFAMNFITVYLITSFPENIMFSLLPQSTVASKTSIILITSFFATIRVLIFGRLIGLFYLYTTMTDEEKKKYIYLRLTKNQNDLESDDNDLSENSDENNERDSSEKSENDEFKNNDKNEDIDKDKITKDDFR